MKKKGLLVIFVIVLTLCIAGCSLTPRRTDTSAANADKDKSSAASTADKETNEKKESKENVSYEITDVFFEHGVNSIGSDAYTGIVEITNNGNTNLYLKDCVFDFEDDNGHLLQTDNVMISSCPDILQPGEKGYFYNSLGGVINENVSQDNGLNFKPNPEVVKANGEPVDYEVSDLSIVDDTFGPKVTGRIKNTSDKDDSLVYVQVVFFNDDNRAIAIEGTNVTDLKAGEQKSFDVSGISLPDSVKSGNYARYEVVSRASYYQFF